MTVVALPNLPGTVKTSLYEVLTSFFDGASHEVSDITYTFPACDIIFEQAKLDQITTPVISIIGERIRTEKNYKCYNPNDLAKQKPGVEARAQVTRSVYVSCPLRGGTNTFNRKTVDEIWGLLYLVFAGKWVEFEAKNICSPVLSAIPVDKIETEFAATAVGLLEFEILYRFGRYNT